ncbi:GNAT family N-acetyltransferase [Nocardioides euryhalodurans]|uniref:GNAT family N-acetyltransferase n=1 Tax=Nocardioides euryhalodurans TaxID=2518370 RepID=UPI001FC93701|nr:GNAT family N-acetyltransferase [Nocardioides euryhalodurans]
MDDATHLTILDRGHELSGVVRPGESWAAAARRTCASLHVEPTPVDLSGEVKRFQVDHDLRIALRAMGRGDLPDVARWRASEQVHRWWAADGEPTLERVTEQYGPAIDGMERTRMWVVEANGRSVGFCQDYRIRDHPGFAVLVPDPEAVGVDYAIGEPHLLGQGIGTAMLWAWVRSARHRYRDVTTYFAAPEHTNLASLRVLEKVGFAPGTWFDEPRADGSVATVVGCSLDVARVVG